MTNGHRAGFDFAQPDADSELRHHQKSLGLGRILNSLYLEPMKIEALIQRLRHAHSPVPLSDFEKIASHFGYMRDRVTGSHHVFRNWSGRKYVVPIHGKKVKAVYIRNFLKEQE